MFSHDYMHVSNVHICCPPRYLFTPALELGHMHPVFYEVTHNMRTSCLYTSFSCAVFVWRTQLREVLHQRVVDGPCTPDMLSWMTQVVLELIGQGDLGYSFALLTTDSANPYGDTMKSFMWVFLFGFRNLWTFLSIISSCAARRPAMLLIMKYCLVLPFLCNMTSTRFRRWPSSGPRGNR